MEKFFNCKNYRLPLGKKTYIMGILNVTPDSFSDGGKYDHPRLAMERARKMVEEGADIIDLGGESTRPGYKSIEAEEEISRVMPVLELLVKEIEVPISIDTNKSSVAKVALEEGAHIINDIWGLEKDPDIASLVAKHRAGLVIMHNKANNHYEDLMEEIKLFLKTSLKKAKEKGIEISRILVDPGIGFGKNFKGNLELLKNIEQLKELDYPILLGSSRKSFIGEILGLPTEERLEGTAASVALGIAAGVDFVRVHDVKEIYRVTRVSDAIVRFER